MRNALVLTVAVLFSLAAVGFAANDLTSNVRDGAPGQGPWILRSPATDGTCELQCPAAAVPEGEPVCYDGYVDNYNGGCNSDPAVFQSLELTCGSITLCGTSGVFDNEGTRDTDWFELNLSEESEVSFCCTAEFALQLLIIDSHTGCQDPDEEILGSVNAAACQQGCIIMGLQPGTYWLWVGPNWGNEPVPCGSNYVMTVTVNARYAGRCCVYPTSLDFDSLTVDTYRDMDFTIYNLWGEPLEGSVEEFCAPYSIVFGGGDYVLGPHESMTVTVRFSPVTVGQQDCQIATGIDCAAVECTGVGKARYCSFPCEDWTADCLGGPNQDVSTQPACIRDDHFAEVFPEGLVVGLSKPDMHKAVWTSAAAVEAFRCGYGLPAPLETNYTDPTRAELGSIYGEAVALHLNREFSCQGHFSDRSLCYGGAVVPPAVPRFAGLNVDELLAIADRALGGDPTALIPYGNSLLRLQNALAYMNQLYMSCGDLVRTPGLMHKFGDGEDVPDAPDRPLPEKVLVSSYPNPLETSVTIRLALPAAGNVSLEIYDVQGRLVVGMAVEPMAEGYHDLTWNGADGSGVAVVSGIYFVRVQVDGRTAVMHKLTKL